MFLSFPQLFSKSNDFYLTKWKRQTAWKMWSGELLSRQKCFIWLKHSHWRGIVRYPRMTQRQHATRWAGVEFTITVAMVTITCKQWVKEEPKNWWEFHYQTNSNFTLLMTLLYILGIIRWLLKGTWTPAVTFVPPYLIDAFIFGSSVRSFTSWQHKMEGQRITKVPVPGKKWQILASNFKAGSLCFFHSFSFKDIYF